MLLSNQSQMQLRSFLDISMNSSFYLVLSASEKEAAFDELKDKPQAQLQQELTLVLHRLSARLLDYFKGEQEIL